MSRGTHLETYIRQQLDRLQAQFTEAVATGQAEAVHQTRVATRRLDEPLQMIGRERGKKAVRRSRRALKKVRTSFSLVREIDVLTWPENGISKLSPAGVEMLRAELGHVRQAALLKAVRRAHKVDLDACRAEILKLVDAFESKCDEKGGLERRLHEFTAGRLASLLAVDERRIAGGDLHPARLSLKRLRYAVEMAQDALECENPQLIRAIKTMQDLLGAWNDHLQAARHLVGIAERRRSLTEQTAWSAGVLAYAAERLQQADAIGRIVAQQWADFCHFVEGQLLGSESPGENGQSSCQSGRGALRLPSRLRENVS